MKGRIISFIYLTITSNQPIAFILQRNESFCQGVEVNAMKLKVPLKKKKKNAIFCTNKIAILFKRF